VGLSCDCESFCVTDVVGSEHVRELEAGGSIRLSVRDDYFGVDWTGVWLDIVFRAA
jgi:hypothetical protein